MTGTPVFVFGLTITSFLQRLELITLLPFAQIKQLACLKVICVF